MPQPLRVFDYSISIHALLAESDELYNRAKALPIKFLSTLSLRRATQARRTLEQAAQISIHALLAESDYPMLLMCLW